MVKKRELTVEKWARCLVNELEIARSLGAERFIEAHEALGHDMADVLFEIQMADKWTQSGMQVYEFDQDFSESIVHEKWVDLLPDCIQNRPHDCFFMKLPCERRNEGVVVFVVPTEDVANFDPELFPNLEEKGVHFGGNVLYGTRVLVNTGEEKLTLCSFAISKTPELMFNDEQIKPYPTELVANGVAYLCSANADIMPSYKPKKETRRNNAKKRSQATWHEVGYRIGAELRAYNRAKSEHSEHHGGTVRPHMRRAHWHHYWIGPRNGERKLVLRWLAPTMVGVGEIKSATGHRVRKEAV